MTKTTSSRGRLGHPPQILSDLILAQQHSDEANNDTGKESVHSPTQQMFGSLRVVHATPGRVRIRATDGSHNSILQSVSEYLRQQKGLKEVAINRQTSSLVVTFDENQLSLPEILALLERFGVGQQNSSDSTNHTDPFAAWKSIDFWTEQGISFIPLFTGLGVTGALGISGLVSIPVYMITADATRRVIDYIQPQLSALKNNKQLHSVSTKNRQVNSEASLEKVEQTTALKKEISATNTVDRANNLAAQSAKNAYSVVHSVPGRVRLNVPRLGSDRAYARRLEKLLKSDSQVTNVRVNCDAVSVVIAYQPGNIPVSHWASLIDLADNKTVTQVIPIRTAEHTPKEERQYYQPQEFATATQTSTEEVSQLSQSQELKTASEDITPEASTLWGNFKTPALSYALAFMAKFPLNAGPD
ncbi:HMA2 domain-containing protein [Chlorogloeopsis sp. ULAP02]|uniref:HMA2 domain-containing protein n=1 Tax=Chlorogloeopsis sp. ULAP02 TaxID=3107926 RepID=UPI003137591D